MARAVRYNWGVLPHRHGARKSFARDGQPPSHQISTSNCTGETSYMTLFLDLIELASGIECPRMIAHVPLTRITATKKPMPLCITPQLLTGNMHE